MPSDKPRAAVGLSGGVDSAVAAALLLEQGYEVIGLTMLTYSGSADAPPGARHSCYGPDEADDLAQAARVCARLGIAHHAIDLRAEYRALVIEPFRAEYLAGRTPNPCVGCNAALKFGFLLERARASGLDFDVFATGHYARIGERGGRPCLMRALDRSKDQSYFLYRIPSTLLPSLRFPLGELSKAETRERARALGLACADRPESQDFMGGGYAALFSPDEAIPGPILDGQGRTLGQHRGLPFYTIGQRRGLGVSSSAPLYVKSIDPSRNAVILGTEASLYRRRLVAAQALMQAWVGSEERVEARIRQNHVPAPAQMRILPGGRLEIEFDEAQRGIAPGQSVVAYSGDWLAGGGIIDSVSESESS
jgi:tRNA-specific 2-thiouridylase